MTDEIHDTGMRIRREVLGDDYMDSKTVTEFTAGFQEFITNYAWGAVWSRPGLDKRTRSAVTVAILTTLGREQELELHLKGAIRNGLTKEEIAEILMHTAVYAGVPAANAAFGIAQRVMDSNEQ